MNSLILSNGLQANYKFYQDCDGSVEIDIYSVIEDGKDISGDLERSDIDEVEQQIYDYEVGNEL